MLLDGVVYQVSSVCSSEATAQSTLSACFLLPCSRLISLRDGMLIPGDVGGAVCSTLKIFLYAQDIEAIFCNKKISHDECKLITSENKEGCYMKLEESTVVYSELAIESFTTLFLTLSCYFAARKKNNIYEFLRERFTNFFLLNHWLRIF